MTRLSMAARSVGAMLSPRLQEPLRRLIGRDAVPRWLNRRWLQQHEVGQRVYGHTRARRALIEELRTAIDDSSLPALLRYEDRNSMAFSIESRVPFLTPELANFMLSLPEEYILAPDGTSKAVFRAAMAGIVPDAILQRRDKIGFSTPELTWLASHEEWVADVLASDAAAATPVLDLAGVRRHARQVFAGNTSSASHLWRCLNLILWTGEFNMAST
jgi:asparagine synthase (glutamine-hydrolysing)